MNGGIVVAYAVEGVAAVGICLRRNVMKKELVLLGLCMSIGLFVYGQTNDFVLVEGGTLLIGSKNGESDEKVHEVTVSSFYIDKYEVTQREWVEVMGTTIQQQRDKANTLYSMRGEGDNYPMYYVSWYEAIEYCNKRSQNEGLTPAYRNSEAVVICDFTANGYRLPTEAEWEFAAKGGIISAENGELMEYSGSNNAGSVGWYKNNSGGKTHEVGTKQPNSLGIYDMSGNVWEWCWDRYGNYFSGPELPDGPRTNPTGALTGSSRVSRGGGWSSLTEYLRSASRGPYSPYNRLDHFGFRVVRSYCL
jgi:formylglycine-generating enzyme required for sulfatase activity